MLVSQRSAGCSTPSQIQKKIGRWARIVHPFYPLERGAQADLYSSSSDLLKVKFDIPPDMEGYL